ncbi:MAG: endonuclease/exonuclease/phosphatase family protein [Clostridia bacterium]|nr:endonuclease/exonuclease/phosphatase family protein [Clostridia bacterium]
MKKVVALCLALITCFSCLVACQPEEKGEELLIIGESCTVLYDVEMVTEAEAKSFANAIKKKTGVEPKLVSSKSFIGGVRASEGTIILGCPDYQIAKDAIGALRNRDYVCGVYGGRYLVGGPSADTTAKAMTHFKNEILEGVGEDKTLTVNSLNNYRFNGEYRLDALTIGGVSIREFSICIPKKPTASEQRTALILQRQIRTRTGYTLPILQGEAATTAGQFRLGALCEAAKATAPHSYALTVKAAVVEMTAESLYGYIALQDVLTSKLFASKESTLALNDDTAYSGDGAKHVKGTLQSDGDVRMLYHNIWGSADGDYTQRAGMLVELYAEYLPDIIGLQEFSPHMRTLMVPALQALGYAEVPVSRNETFYGSESYTRTPLFYRTETVELLEAGYNCLAVMNYGKYPELLGGFSASEVRSAAVADRSKAVTWGIFRTKQGGKLFLAGSTHLWWMDGAVHDIARTVQMQEMRNLVTEAAAGFLSAKGLSGTMPIYIGGDFNTRTIRDSYHSMGRETPFDAIHTYLPVNARPKDCTTHEYPTYNADTGLWEQAGQPWESYNYALDYIFANREAKDTYTVLRLEMLYEEYAFAGSDHSPIFADLDLGAAVPALPAQ